jgi:peptidoglycan/LPS O-acetylase OafA/YrhL
MKNPEQNAYFPGLDGIRAIAVSAVVLYHLQMPFADGGLLGVSVFFTLSGFLITSLLLAEHQREGRIALGGFWIRRARRLLPALLLMVPVVVAATFFARPSHLADVTRDSFYALLYVANWATILRGGDYFQRFSGPGPLDHLWSLAIEEQFYLVWPLVVAGLLLLSRRRTLPLAVVTALLVVASTWAMFHAYDPMAQNNTRAYEGTDTRAAALLLGALAAVLLPLHRISKLAGRAAKALDVLSVAGLATIVTCIVVTDEYSSFLYRGGELGLALASSLLAIGASHPQTLMSRVLSTAPMRWIGARSYGIYLWHMPVVAFMPEEVLAESPALRGAFPGALILVLAAISYRLGEDPIRRRVPFARGWRVLMRAVPVAIVATVALAIWPMGVPTMSPMEALAAEAPPSSVEPTPMPAPVLAAEPTGLATKCVDVVHVGDSTSIGLTSNRFLPDPNDQIGARYRAVGVERFWPEISGARSMVETIRSQVNATDIVERRVAAGYEGCFVLALGTNDPANTSGNARMLAERIDAMMARAGGRPVLWTTTKTLRAKGPYRNENMAVWNRVVVDACTRYPNMRVYDWATEVQDDWFLRDAVHFNSLGSRERSTRIATALAHAFPRNGSSSQCLVSGE